MTLVPLPTRQRLSGGDFVVVVVLIGGGGGGGGWGRKGSGGGVVEGDMDMESLVVLSSVQLPSMFVFCFLSLSEKKKEIERERERESFVGFDCEDIQQREMGDMNWDMMF